MDVLLEKLYYDPETGFISANALHKKVKEVDSSITLKQLKDWYKMKLDIQRHVEQRGTYDDYRIASSNTDSWQMDLAFWEGKSILTGVNINSRLGFAKLIKNKRADTVLNAIKEFVNEHKASVLTTDNGSEFMNRKATTWLKSQKITHFNNDSGDHATMGKIERFNRTLKMRLIRMKQSISEKLVKSVINNYNNTWHSSINKTPNQAKGEVMEDDLEHNRKLRERMENELSIGSTVMYPQERDLWPGSFLAHPVAFVLTSEDGVDEWAYGIVSGYTATPETTLHLTHQHGSTTLPLLPTTAAIKADVLNYVFQTGGGVNIAGLSPMELIEQQNEVIAACRRRRSGLPKSVTKNLSVPYKAAEVVPLINPATLKLVRVRRQHVVDYKTAAASKRLSELYSNTGTGSTLERTGPNSVAASRTTGRRRPATDAISVSSDLDVDTEPLAIESDDADAEQVRHIHRPLAKRRRVETRANYPSLDSSDASSYSADSSSSDDDGTNRFSSSRERGVVFHPSPTEHQVHVSIVQQRHAGLKPALRVRKQFCRNDDQLVALKESYPAWTATAQSAGRIKTTYEGSGNAPGPFDRHPTSKTRIPNNVLTSLPKSEDGRRLCLRFVSKAGCNLQDCPRPHFKPQALSDEAKANVQLRHDRFMGTLQQIHAANAAAVSTHWQVAAQQHSMISPPVQAGQVGDIDVEHAQF
ncbi:unnamed protein product [Phytophthora fragariaefolia]|uniref:Unnamed protein product n=1 Tax=Phytophthora fragariaefolia TaxID=1490495 RepID=A0A9W6TJA6_9STRA|nr:unnamed protein product [Phytophthora fragariaefolia]